MKLHIYQDNNGYSYVEDPNHNSYLIYNLFFYDTLDKKTEAVGQQYPIKVRGLEMTFDVNTIRKTLPCHREFSAKGYPFVTKNKGNYSLYIPIDKVKHTLHPDREYNTEDFIIFTKSIEIEGDFKKLANYFSDTYNEYTNTDKGMLFTTFNGYKNTEAYDKRQEIAKDIKQRTGENIYDYLLKKLLEHYTITPKE